ncbi:hypothetical protein HR12_47625 [Microbacterium sp. SUBG005]|nr:hypothetical protein HR12_47625 [Microbacterium sp. SUBG005]
MRLRRMAFGPGDVVQDAAHRATLHRFSSVRCTHESRSTSAKMTITHKMTRNAFSPRSLR